jgi:invasion protein IalB
MKQRRGQQLPSPSRRASVLAVAGTLLVISLAQSTYAQQATPSGGAEVAQRGQRAARAINYGDWRKFCFKPAGTGMVCRTTISGTWETGQTAVRIDLIEREDGGSRLQMFLPVGLYLQAGVKLTIDQGTPFKIPYVWCLTNACIAGDVTDPKTIREMETGQQLLLEVVDSSVLAVTTSLPLKGFQSARQGAPTQTFDQDIDE